MHLNMRAGAGGYVLDTPYTAEYHPDLHPSRLFVAALLAGHVPRFDPDYPTYCELGCGNGLTLALIARALPGGRFVGVDVNPDHVARARTLAEDAGLTNVRFVEADFGEADERLGDETFDIVAAHGVYSWIGETQRAALETFVQNRLATAGLFQVSYNAQPRWAAVEPARKMVHELMAMRADAGDTALTRALETWDTWRRHGAGWFASPGGTATALLEGEQRRRPSWRAYAVHEYGGADWQSWYHCDVRQRMEKGTGLAYVGQMDLARAWPDASGTRDMESALAAIEDAGMQETMRDYLVQPLLRHEIYARGLLPRSARVRQALLDARRFVLVTPPERLTPDVELPVGSVRLDQERFDRLVEHLRERGADTLGRLVNAMGGDELEAAGASRRLALLLCRARHLEPVPSAEAVCGRGNEERFNAAIAEWAQDRTPFGALLSAHYGIGCPAGTLAQLVWQAMLRGTSGDAATLVDTLVERDGVRIRPSGDESATLGERGAALDAVTEVLEHEVPLLRRLLASVET